MLVVNHVFDISQLSFMDISVNNFLYADESCIANSRSVNIFLLLLLKSSLLYVLFIKIW